jgi:hypothetical protein
MTLLLHKNERKYDAKRHLRRFHEKQIENFQHHLNQILLEEI